MVVPTVTLVLTVVFGLTTVAGFVLAWAQGRRVSSLEREEKRRLWIWLRTLRIAAVNLERAIEKHSEDDSEESDCDELIRTMDTQQGRIWSCIIGIVDAILTRYPKASRALIEEWDKQDKFRSGNGSEHIKSLFIRLIT